MTPRKYLLAGAAAAALISVAYGASDPHGTVAAAARDLGPASAFSENAVVTVTVALNLRNPEQLEKLIESINTSGAPQYHQFLTPAQFKTQFGPSAATIAAVTKEFESQGLAVTQSATAHLRVSGTVAQIEKAFGVELHAFNVAASGASPEYSYRAPLGDARLPSSISGSVHAILGLDTKPHLRPHLRNTLKTPLQRLVASGNGTPNTTDPPGQWTVLDYAQYYDLQPLYDRGVTGRGRTIGIATLASFTQSDAYTYWNAIGITVRPNRITEVQVDGGPGAPSDASGSDETTLDVEQSGGLSPGASIIVYEAPNTNQGFADVLAAAVDANIADTLSVSWGEWEGFDGSNPVIGNGNITDPATGRQTDIIKANDDVLAQAACQGQTWFASTGDYGAYDSANSLPLEPSDTNPFSYNPVLSVDDPAMQRYITAAGGTTLAGVQTYGLPSGQSISIDVKQERVWGWDYLQPLCDALGLTAIQCGIYPAGGGGGVSIYVPLPFYQWFTPGMASTVRGQELYQLTPAPAQELYKLRAGFLGRNVPDISTNADPQTGYVYYYSSSVSGPGFYQAGGTSFVAPELNGVSNLFVQALHHRIGLFNPAMYLISELPGARAGRHAAFNDVKTGNNWYWYGRPGYDQGSGLGTPDWANFFDYLSELER